MDMNMRQAADAIVAASIRAVQPDEAVSRALQGKEFPGRVVLVAAGKAVTTRDSSPWSSSTAQAVW